MKHIKLFENYLKEIENIFKDIKNHKIGDIISYTTLYNYVDALHDFEMNNDFIEEHILKYPKFKLVELNIEDLELDQISPSLVNDYIDMYKENNWYPPIIYDVDEGIVDGYHRTTALNKMGVEKVLAWVGVES